MPCRRDTQPSSPNSVKLRQEGRPDPCEGSTSTDSMSPTGCIHRPYEPYWVPPLAHASDTGVVGMANPQEGALLHAHNQTEEMPTRGHIPRRLSSPGTGAHTHLYTLWGSHIPDSSCPFLSVLLSSSHKLNLRRSIKSQSQTLTHTSPGTAIFLH